MPPNAYAEPATPAPPLQRSSFAIDVPDALLVRVRGGERGAFEQLYRWFERPVFTLAMRMLGGNREEAAEVLQDTMLKVFHKVGDFQGGSPFWGWLRQIAVNEALMRLRSQRRGRSTDRGSCPPTPPRRLRQRHLRRARRAASSAPRAGSRSSRRTRYRPRCRRPSPSSR